MDLFWIFCRSVLPSVLRRCWLGGRKGIRLVKQESLASAKVNARQHCVSLSRLGDEDSGNIASERYENGILDDHFLV